MTSSKTSICRRTSTEVSVTASIMRRSWTLIGRVGAGTSREFGGEDDRWVPEGLFGVEYSQQLNATQKVYSKLDWFPELDDTGEFRAVADVGWEVVLVQPSNLSLKISANDRYDSTPEWGRAALMNYSVLLLLKL